MGAQQEHEKKITRLFNLIDTTQSGYISRAGFEHLFLHNPTLKLWLSAQGIDVGANSLLFDLLDDGDNALTVSELVTGIGRLKGAAKSLDLIGLMHMTSHMCHVLTKLDRRLIRMEASYSES